VVYMVSVTTPTFEEEEVAISPRGRALYASHDGGISWELRGRSLSPGYHTYWAGDASCAAGEDRCTGINYRRLAVDPLAPDLLWSANHNGIFASTDGGRSWANRHPITRQVLGEVQAVDVHHSGGTPARVAVVGEFKIAWSVDNGRTWEVRAVAKVHNSDGDRFEGVQIDSIVGGPASEDLVALYRFPDVPQVLIHRARGWSQTSPPFVGSAPEDSPFGSLAGISYDVTGDAYWMLTEDDGSHLVRLKLARR
jgi:photosystem II stability/assembly factor-like uncharacterized protein